MMSAPRTDERARRAPRLPLYEQVRISLLSDIRQGRLTPGDRLESEAELCARFGVSRTVVRQALGDLTTEGYLTRVQGKGTFVSEPRQREYLLREYFLHTAGGFMHDVASRGHEVVSEVVGLREAEADAVTAQSLELIVRRVVVLERVRFVNGEPVVFTRSYLPAALCPDLAERLRVADLDRRSLYDVLEAECGVRIVAATRQIEAVSADGELAERMAVSVGSPLLLLRSVARDASARPVEYFDSWHRGDRTRFEISLGGELLRPAPAATDVAASDGRSG